MYLACEEMDHTWDESEVLLFDNLWQAGVSVYEIAECFKRDPDEIALLAIDRAKKRFIKRRSGGAWGGGFPRSNKSSK
ncbi:hypothetical protein ACFOLF_12355 [Paenibacillus sepulcri]|uniref:Helix-turn-helix domain containing protein n=1 Tax=Paenibacillus sepulcri TaxID=359917 RepID=A0ABS7BYZ3_9BACL|nr:hypothetical protein [Paenibacillus sepulcri]